MIRSDGRALRNDNSALIKERLQRASLPLRPHEDTVRCPFGKEKAGALPDTESVGALILDVLDHRMVRNQVLLCVSFPVYGI